MSARRTGSVMPQHPIRQKHGNPKTDNSLAFLDSLRPGPDDGADVDARLVWNDHTRKNKASGCHIFALHGETAASNGYHYRMVNGRCRKMSAHDQHRNLATWDAAEVFTWRKGPSPSSAHPITLNTAYGYVAKHGGTIIAELKSREFRFKWVMQQLAEDSARHNQPLWFKALSNMAYFEGKAIACTSATIRLHDGTVVHPWFAVIYGTHIKGRSKRLAAGRRDTAGWPPAVLEYTRIW